MADQENWKKVRGEWVNIRDQKRLKKVKVGGIRPSDDPELIKLKMKKEKEELLRTKAGMRRFNRGGKV